MRKEYKDAEGATIMTVVWSNHSFQLLTWADLSRKERKEFDWLDTPEKRASVISATRSGPTHLVAFRYSAGCRWTPSLISSIVTRGSSIRAVIGPGSRWCNGRIALNR